MEVVNSKTGEERVIERINFEKIRVTGKSERIRRQTKNGVITLFDFDSGPHYNVGGVIRFEKMNYQIKEIKQNETSTPDLVEIVLTVSPKF